MFRHVAISSFLVNGALALGCGATAWRLLSVGEDLGCLFLVLAEACAAALVCRWGAIVPCLTIGLICGILFDTGPRSGTVESQMWEMVESYVGGAMAGVLIGAAIDWRQRRLLNRDDKLA